MKQSQKEARLIKRWNKARDLYNKCSVEFPKKNGKYIVGRGSYFYTEGLTGTRLLA